MTTSLPETGTPSTALYFENAMAKWIEPGRVERLAQTVFRHENSLIVIRHTSGLRKLPPHDRLFYVIDDDWRAGLRDPALPAWYRARLALREARAALRLENRADVLLAASAQLVQALREKHPSKDVRLLEPAWPKAETPVASQNPRTLCHLSARTHGRDFQFLLPMLENALKNMDVRLTVSANAPLPGAWRDNARIDILPVMNWQEYRRWMVGKCFDVALYPTLEGSFNQARSRNKLLEYDQFGAAILCSDTWAPGRMAADQGRCRALPNETSAWIGALNELLDRPGAAKVLAKANRDALIRENPLSRQLETWNTFFIT